MEFSIFSSVFNRLATFEPTFSKMNLNKSSRKHRKNFQFISSILSFHININETIARMRFVSLEFDELSTIFHPPRSNIFHWNRFHWIALKCQQMISKEFVNRWFTEILMSSQCLSLEVINQLFKEARTKGKGDWIEVTRSHGENQFSTLAPVCLEADDIQPPWMWSSGTQERSHYNEKGKTESCMQFFINFPFWSNMSIKIDSISLSRLSVIKLKWLYTSA